MKESIYEKDFLTVNEFARIVGVTAETLRHYDRIGVFRAEEKDRSNRYRYYSATQITAIKMIKVLTDIKVHLDTIKEFAVGRSPENLIKLLSKHKTKVGDEIRFLQEAHSVIGTFLDLLVEGISATEPDVSVVEMPEKSIILGEPNDFSGTSNFHREYIRFCNGIYEPPINLAYPIGGYFESMDVFSHQPSRPSRFFSIDPRGNEKKEAGLYLIGYARGYYGQTGDVADRMAEVAKKNKLLFNGPVYNIYLFDEMSVADPCRYLLQVSASVTETRRAPSRRPGHQ